MTRTPTGDAPIMTDRKSTRLNSSHTVISTLSLHDALPISNFNRIDQFESSASSRGYSASISYRGQLRKLQLIVHYTLARTLDSASTMTSRPANNYDANADWGRADYDRSEEHTSELQSHSDLHSFPTRRSSDLKLQQN